ncbi:heparan-alpha-glucosaminide N-acetyltransferase isoform X2 [Alligator mississippiensis]|uniref:heparan-alpha-glucosaminide N-acetyltransferase isoform X2 n=1 Tax=Alligator mississippiensis TaxID=8496 RepID=UPI002877BD34|nr:heparan-alpha-glucosaminide N-acetyltransferase isoform X2 [Alligator mississippiensis]
MFEVFAEINTTSPVCRWSELYGEHGWYLISIQSVSDQHTRGISCTHSVDKAPVNSYIPLLVAFAILVAVALMYFLGSFVSKLQCTEEYCHLLQHKCFFLVFHHQIRQIVSLDQQWGTLFLSSSSRITALQKAQGQKWGNLNVDDFFPWTHSEGLTIADLVMPWFVFILGTSVALAFSAMLRRGVTRVQLLRKMMWRTVVLLAIGVFFLNYGPADGPLSWSWARIPGVLQRLGFTYFTVALMQTCFSVKDVEKYQNGNWWAPVREIVLYWPEWIIIAVLETIWLCLTFLLLVPGCPRGYLGPGGIGDDGKYPNCTGGAAGYIDKWLLGEDHIYHYPTCKELYKTTQPFDPEGVLGTINSVVMAFFGLQAGKITLLYRKQPLSILKRFLIWAVLLGIISAILTKCTQNEGFIPVNKNLWSLSFVTTLSCFSFILLGLMFYVIDVKNWWDGQPFIYPGMNSFFVYVGHSILGSYFPFNWEMKFPDSHAEPLFQDLLGTSLWVFVAYFLYRKKFFLKI